MGKCLAHARKILVRDTTRVNGYIGCMTIVCEVLGFLYRELWASVTVKASCTLARETVRD